MLPLQATTTLYNITQHMTCIDNDEEKVLVYVIKMHKHIYKFKIKVRGRKDEWT